MNELPDNTIFPLDLSKPIRTRDGRKVRILATDATYTCNGVPQPLCAVISCSEDGRDNLIGFWSASGKFNENDPHESGADIINVPPKKKKIKVDVRLYRDVHGNIQSNAIHEGDIYSWDNIESAISGTFIAATVIEMEYEEQP